MDCKKQKNNDKINLPVLANFHKAYHQLKKDTPLLTSFNQYLVADALHYADNIGVSFDVTSICAHTGIQRSSLKITLNNMSESGLITIQRSDVDARRKIVIPEKVLLDQYLDVINNTRKLLIITSSHFS